MDYGNPVHGEVSSADASGGVTVLLYPSGSATAITLGATEFLTITDVILVSTAGGVYALVADTDAAGRRIVKGNAEALGGIAHTFETRITCPKGVTPKLIAAAGQIDLVISGYITRS